MRILAAPHAVVPALPERTGHHADDPVLALEDRALLDVRFEVGVEGASPDGRVAGVADALQRIAERRPVDVALLQQMRERKHAGERARAAHDRNEATAFLVGPYRDTDGLLGRDAGRVERAQYLQASQNTVVAVELAARRLRVDMASGEHDRPRRIAARPYREDIAGAVDFDARARLAQPAHHQIAALPVEIGERESPHAAPGRRTDGRELHQRLPQALAVDAQRVECVGGIGSYVR